MDKKQEQKQKVKKINMKGIKLFKRGVTILLLLVFSLSSISVSILSSIYGIEYTDENIDDRYGRLDENTRLVLEKEIKENMKEFDVEIYFSYIFEDMNEIYKDNLSKQKQAIFFFYNETTQELGYNSILPIEKGILTKSYTVEKNNLASELDRYIDNVCDAKDYNTKTFYIPYMTIFLLVTALIGAFVFVALIFYVPKYFKEFNFYLNERKRQKATARKLKELEQARKEENN